MCRRSCFTAAAYFVMGLLAAPGQAASPRLARFVPGAVPAGKTVDVILEGERMEDPLGLHFYEEGIRAIALKVEDDAVRVTLQIDPDCRIGEHIGHLRTRTGITEYRPLYVIPLETHFEKENNNTKRGAQDISLNQAYCGRLLEGDRDYYAVDVPEKMVLNIELLAMRLGNTALDSIVTLYDASGKKIASATGHTFSINDPILRYEVNDPGRYFIEVRELLGGGNEQSHYVLCIGNFPRPLALYPPGGPLGQELNIQCRGDLRGVYEFKTRTPEEENRHHSLAPAQNGLQPPTPIPFRLSRHLNLLEHEPNNSINEANAAEITEAFCGVIEHAGDEDWFKFDAQKGQALEIEVYARRVRSPLDVVISIYDGEGEEIENNDDGGKVTDHSDAESRGADSFLRFNPPQTGAYYLQVADILATGSPSHVYRIECVPAEPWMIVRLPRVQDPNELYGQYRQQIFVARGNRFAALARARTRDFSGRLRLEIPELPDGVSYETQAIPAGTTGFPIVFTATEDAPLGGGLYVMRGKHEDSDKNIEGGYYNFADLLRAKANLSLLKTRIAEKVPIVVTDAIPFRIEGESPGTPIVRSGLWNLKVRVIRDQGFNGPIRLTMPFLPPGIATSSGEVIPADKTEAVFRLTAHSKITPRDWRIYVQGVAGEENNWMWASTQIIPLKVEKGFVGLALGKARAAPGSESMLRCEIEAMKEFEGEARIELSGLPDNVEFTSVVFKDGQDSIGIPLKITESASPGLYQGIRAKLSVPSGDSMVESQFGPTTLEITKADNQKPSSSVLADNNAELEKPLSRLEQLRADAKARRDSTKEVPR